jgi:hypothetical protein
MLGKLSGREIKDIILAGKSAKCRKIEYNGLVITYESEKITPSEVTLLPGPNPAPDSPTKTLQKEIISNELSAEDELELLKFNDPVAYEDLIQGAKWNNQKL